MISTNFNIIIDRIIGAPGHGKLWLTELMLVIRDILLQKCV